MGTAPHTIEMLPAATVVHNGVEVAALRTGPDALPLTLQWATGDDGLGPSRSAVVRLEPEGVTFALVAYDADPDGTVVVIGERGERIGAQLLSLYGVLGLDRRRDVLGDVIEARDAPEEMGQVREPAEASEGEARADPIADFLSRIRDAIDAGHETVDVPASKLKRQMARILAEQGYIAGFDIKSPTGDRPEVIRIRLADDVQRGAPIDLSRPGLRGQSGAPKVVRSATFPNTRTVAPHPQGWAVEKPGATRASSIHHTQRQAIDAARAMLKRSGGGELAIMGRDGRVRAQDTIAPGKDPRRSRD